MNNNTKAVFLNEDMSVIPHIYAVYVDEDVMHFAAGHMLKHNVDAAYVEVQTLGTGECVGIWSVERTTTRPDTHINNMSYTHRGYSQCCEYAYGKHMPTIILRKEA